MPVETATYISDLNASNPPGTDGLAQADEHLRLIKSTIKATFPNIDAPVTVTEDELNAVGTLDDGSVTNAKLDDMAQSTIKGRAAGAGTGAPTDLTATQATAILNAVVGDSGSGGTKGLVPAPAAGDAAALKYLKADGTWATVAGVADDSITNAKLANVATATFKGRTTAGTGDPEDLTATQATAILNAVVGDSGSGGTKGLVPAPSAGDAAASKFLKADGTWATVTAGARTLIETLNPSGVAQQDTSDLTGYNVIILTVYGLTPAADAGLTIQKSTDGSTFSDWSDAVVMSILVNGAATSETYNNSVTASRLLSEHSASGQTVESTASAGGWSGTIILRNFNQSKECNGEFHGFYASSTNRIATRGYFYDSGTTARVKLRLVFNGQNISSGRITVEGIA